MYHFLLDLDYFMSFRHLDYFMYTLNYINICAKRVS